MKVNTLPVENLDELKKEDLSVLMIWVNGCAACSQAKEGYAELPKKFQDYKFFEMELTNPAVYDFYSNFTEKQPVMEEVKDEDGDIIYDAKGKALTRLSRDENGELIQKAPIQVPKFLVFHGSSIDEENEYGFLGNVDGYNLPMLEQILENIQKMQQEEVASA